MSSIDPIRFGLNEGHLKAVDERLVKVENTVNNISEKVDTVLIALAEKRGERRAAAYIAGLTASLVSIVIAVVAEWTKK
jgi:hypothetical protein